jgi:hypothetical protein
MWVGRVLVGKSLGRLWKSAITQHIPTRLTVNLTWLISSSLTRSLLAFFASTKGILGRLYTPDN